MFMMTITSLGTGCQGIAMTQQDSYAHPGAGSLASSESLTFKRHNFGAFCYSTYGCHVTYNGFTHVSEPGDVLQLSSASLGDKYPANLDASYLSVGNFPEPASVVWRSKDGVKHSTFVDIASVFRDQRVLHHVPKGGVDGDIGDPGIILEVNDRTINVYMKAFVPTREPQVSGNKHSYFRDDLTLAWSKAY
ncbi:hypothetical protein C0063_06725 [Pseudoxanthomonas sp. KAs_5_3]|nr:hypothetical protein C0063_06725 [Pseudoxanthomonas sp. KAs_5_3]